MLRNLFAGVVAASCLICAFANDSAACDLEENCSNDLRIAIVGAGASGLTAAHTLRDLGYENIVVFEKESRPGGKVESYEYEGHIYELGAVWLGASYKKNLALAEEYGVPFQTAESVGVYEDGVFYTYDKYALHKYSVWSLGWSVVNMWNVQRRFPTLGTPGFAGGRDDLHLNMIDFAKKYRVEAATELVASFITACGYGYYEEVPAQYLLKLVPSVINATIREKIGLINIPMSSFTNGWQSLWQAVADDFDVRYDSEVTQITRSVEDGRIVIDVTVGGASYEFDRVIISTPPEAYPHFLDMTDAEKDIFDRVETYKYAVTVFKGEGIPHASMTDRVTADTIGSVIFFGHYYPETDVYLSYQLLPKDKDGNDAVASLQDEVDRVGGTLKEVVHQKIWSYFPHFKKADLDQGVDEAIDAMQGQLGTYYIGGLMNFETVETTAAFAEALMREHFEIPSDDGLSIWPF